MALGSRRKDRATNIWPGFVDALATLLMVMMFLLMVFVLAQFFLGEALSGRDEALEKLDNKLAEIADLLAMERSNNATLRTNIQQLSDELQASVTKRDDLSSQLSIMTDRAIKAEDEANEQAAELTKLAADIAALTALKESLEKETAQLSRKLDETGKALIDEKELSETAQAQVALLNKQMAAVKEQLASLQEALAISERKNKEQNVEIIALGKRLNAALATKVHELSRYRSEFFGKLREILGQTKGVQIVGDRFVFQSEVLFESGSADIGEGGQRQLAHLAKLLKDLAAKIPDDIDWVLRVDGHTDTVPIRNLKFASNWELSSARAISVVKLLIKNGIPADRLVAAGFGQYQPLDDRKDEIAKRRNRRIELKLTQR